MNKLVPEKLNEVYDGYTSSSTHSNVNYDRRKKTTPDSPDWIDPDELRSTLLNIIENSSTIEKARNDVSDFLDNHIYVHSELGEINGKDYYKEAMEDVLNLVSEKFL
jgi:hypothetical protein